MGEQIIKFRKLKNKLASYGVSWEPNKGKGSHGTFEKLMDGGVYTFTVPNHEDIPKCYTKAIRKKFKLTPEDGVTDSMFYGKG